MSSVTGLYAGTLQALQPEGQRSGIYKLPIEQAEVTRKGIVGDQQADLRFHGGPEKALHQYACDSYELIVSHYPQLRGVAIPGSLGENLSSPDLNDADVCIGDVYRMGQVLLQVSQPRSPCWKINHKFAVDKLSLFIEQHRITGWYYRVLEMGRIRIGDPIQLLQRPNEGITIEHFHRVYKQHRPELEALDTLIACEGLNEEWRRRISSRRQYLVSLVED